LNRKIRLVVFDLDGTLTSVNSLWEYLHEEFGTWDQGKIAARKYQQGEISYREWAENDAKCWAGIPVSRIVKVLDRIPYRQGTRDVFKSLKERDVKTAIVSAGLSLLADKAAMELGADFTFSNELQTNDGHLTGKIKVTVAVNGKKQIIEEIASNLGIELNEVALIGDQAFDLAQPACLRIAFKPKNDAARQQADVVVNDDDLSRILQYIT
jgi:phosphoserine phosphatase